MSAFESFDQIQEFILGQPAAEARGRRSPELHLSFFLESYLPLWPFYVSFCPFVTWLLTSCLHQTEFFHRLGFPPSTRFSALLPGVQPWFGVLQTQQTHTNVPQCLSLVHANDVVVRKTVNSQRADDPTSCRTTLPLTFTYCLKRAGSPRFIILFLYYFMIFHQYCTAVSLSGLTVPVYSSSHL